MDKTRNIPPPPSQFDSSLKTPSHCLGPKSLKQLLLLQSSFLGLKVIDGHSLFNNIQAFFCFIFAYPFKVKKEY
jgi:hypothetical protein